MYYIMRQSGVEQEYLAAGGKWTRGTRAARSFYNKQAAETCLELLHNVPGRWVYVIVAHSTPVLRDVA